MSAGGNREQTEAREALAQQHLSGGTHGNRGHRGAATAEADQWENDADLPSGDESETFKKIEWLRVQPLFALTNRYGDESSWNSYPATAEYDSNQQSILRQEISFLDDGSGVDLLEPHGGKIPYNVYEAAFGEETSRQRWSEANWEELNLRSQVSHLRTEFGLPHPGRRACDVGGSRGFDHSQFAGQPILMPVRRGKNVLLNLLHNFFKTQENYENYDDAWKIENLCAARDFCSGVMVVTGVVFAIDRVPGSFMQDPTLNQEALTWSLILLFAVAFLFNGALCLSEATLLDHEKAGRSLAGMVPLCGYDGFD